MPLDIRLYISQVCPCCIRQSTVIMSREVILPFCSVLLRPHQEQCAALIPLGKGVMSTFWRQSSGGPLRLEHLSYRGRLRDPGPSSHLGEEKAQGDLIRSEPGSFQWCTMIDQESVSTNWSSGGYPWASWSTLFTERVFDLWSQVIQRHCVVFHI